MNTSQISRCLAAVGVCLGFAQTAAAQDSIAAEPVSVWIFSDRYLSSEPVVSEPDPSIAAEPVSVWIFSDRYLSSEPVISEPGPSDARVLTRSPVIRLDLCEPFASALLSTAYLFRDFHLEIRPLTSEHSVCMAETVARVVRVSGTGQILSLDEGKAVGRYWAGLMP